MSFPGKISIKTSCNIPLGSSPRPLQLSRPAPIIIPRTYSDIIEQEEVISPKTLISPKTVVSPRTLVAISTKVNPIMCAIKDIVKTRIFNSPLLEMPAPIIPGKLYLGDGAQATDVDMMKALGVTAILNCASGSCLTNASYYDEKFIYHEFDAHDSCMYEMSSHIIEAYAFFTRCMEENRSVFVHCAAGINRSPFIAIYIYMTIMGVSLVDAVKHCFQLRPIILCNENFIKQLVIVAVREECAKTALSQ